MNKKLKPIPEFKSYKEEAEFWDTHDTTEYFDMENAYMVTPKKTEVLTVKLSDSDKTALKRIAHTKRLSSSALVRSWIVEHINEAKMMKA